MSLKCLRAKNVVLGEGRPKICAPLVGKTLDELLEEASIAVQEGADLAEWRVDFFEIESFPEVLEAAFAIRNMLRDLPLLFTFRTKREGGERQISKDAYIVLNRSIIANQAADLIDFELSAGEETCRELIQLARKKSIISVVSQHDFKRTPTMKTLVTKFLHMSAMGGDIPKIAVMPSTPEDVLTLLRATREAVNILDNRPVISMSMGSLGVVSRVAGEAFGSCVTFGSLKKASAPGQIAVGELKSVLNLLRQD